MDDATKAELVSKYGERLIKCTTVTGTVFVFRGPNRGEWSAYMRAQLGMEKNPNAALGAMEQLTNQCLVYPRGTGAWPGDIPAWTAALEVEPGLAQVVIPELQALAGVGGAEEAKRVGKL